MKALFVIDMQNFCVGEKHAECFHFVKQCRNENRNGGYCQ